MSKKHVQILKEARALIESGRETYICFALGHAGHRLNCEFEANRIVDRVLASLSPNTSLGGWLWTRGFRAQPERHMQEHRLKWLDLMIEQWRDAE